MGHPLPARSANDLKADLIVSALSRARGAKEVGEVLGWKSSSESLLEYVRSLPDEGDVNALETLLADARTARGDLEKDFYRILKKVKTSTGDQLAEKADGYFEEAQVTFQRFLDSQDAVTSIRDDLNLIKDIVDGRPKRAHLTALK